MNSVAAPHLTARPSSTANCIFGELRISAEQLSEKIKTLAPSLAKHYDPEEKNTAWTKAVKETLDSIAAEYLCKSLWTKKEPKCAEFMLDLVWWEDIGARERAVLGVEIEWGNPWNSRNRNVERMVDAADDEFWKFLCFKAPLKMLVYITNGLAMRQAIHERLRDDISKFGQHVTGECYMLIEFSPVAQCYRYMFSADSDGTVPNPRFTPLDDESGRALAA